MRSPSWSKTCCAVVGDTCVKGLALGAASGTPAAAISRRATGCDGTRTPTVSSPPVTTSGTSRRLGKTIVSGPGQNRSASRSASGDSARATAVARSADSTCTISGLKAGRPLTANTRSTAAASRALAPSPYTVSVGNATSLPSRSHAPGATSAATVASRSEGSTTMRAAAGCGAGSSRSSAAIGGFCAGEAWQLNAGSRAPRASAADTTSGTGRPAAPSPRAAAPPGPVAAPCSAGRRRG